jgi:hypothetical protein
MRKIAPGVKSTKLLCPQTLSLPRRLIIGAKTFPRDAIERYRVRRPIAS